MSASSEGSETTIETGRERAALLADSSVRPAGSGRTDVKQFLASLLEMQCGLVGAIAGVFYMAPSPAREGGLLARYATGEGDELLTGRTLKRLERLGERATTAASTPGDNGRGAIGFSESLSGADESGLYGAGPTVSALAVPLVAEGRVEGASVLVLRGRAVESDPRLRIVALTGARFESFLWRQQCFGEAEQKTRLRETLELLDTTLEAPSAEAMGSVVCHELRRRFGCSRVSIGLIHRGRVRLRAVSGSDNLDRRGAAVEAIEDAMEECAEQDAEILYPQPPAAEHDPGTRRITRAHESLSTRFGPSAMLSLPLRVEGHLVGVALLEREPTEPFPPGSVPLLRLVGEFIGPALWTRRLADRGVLAVTRDRLVDLGEAIVGPRHTGKKLLALLLILVLAGLAFVPIPGRVPGEAEVQAAVARTIVPPFRGYLREIHVRPGDPVEAGDRLATMDESQLVLQLAETESRLAGLEIERSKAQSEREFEKAEQLAAQMAEARAQRDLVRQQIERSTLVAPISGTVSRGDLEQLAGALVEPTQPLMEIIGADRRVVLRVDERDISSVEIGQEGWFAPRARPGERIGIVVTRINPAAEADEGANVYLVEAEPGDPDVELSPGMTGVAKLKRGWTTGLVRLLRPTIDEARLRLWW